MSDLFRNHIVGFPTRRLICMFSTRHHAHDASSSPKGNNHSPENQQVKLLCVAYQMASGSAVFIALYTALPALSRYEGSLEKKTVL